MHGIQMWVALPEAHEDDAPSFEHHPQATLPEVEPAAGVRGRVLIGAAFGARSPIRHPSEPLLVDLELGPGASVEVPDAAERGVFVIEGEVRVDEHEVDADRLIVLGTGARAIVSATAPSRLLIVGGPAMGKRLIDWNFVASTQDRIERARDDWKALRFPRIPTDDGELAPYPDLRR